MKKPRLFYYEEAVNSFIPVPFDGDVNAIICVSSLCEGEENIIRFKRIDMTDEEFDNLPET